MNDYSFPVDRLMPLGASLSQRSWPDYRAQFGFGVEHIPELTRLAMDKKLHLDSNEPESWAPIHALHALSQLGAIEQVPTLLEFISDMDSEDLMGDWVTEDLKHWLADFGLEIVPLLKAELKRLDRSPWVRSAIASALAKLTTMHPEMRGEVIDAICAELDRPERYDDDCTVNGAFVAYLLDLKAVEAAPVIERAFAADRVDESHAGDWPEVWFELGLGPKPARRQRRFGPLAIPRTFGSQQLNPKERAEQRKAERKAARKAKKRNR